jgi:DNA-binding response OmpR family regulator
MTRILIVEDDAGIALGLEEDLSLEGYGVEIVRDGVSAVTRARETACDLILLDVMLPGKDGFQVCRELRRTGVTTPIILLTARAGETDKVFGLQLGADDYLTKPFSSAELRARIDAVLRRARPATDRDVYRFGDVDVDFTRGEVRRGGELVAMTPVEFRLLAAFIRHRGRVLSREQLLDQVWNDVHCGPRVVDTHMANLRRKVEPDPQAPRFLASVRGMGYRFDG